VGWAGWVCGVERREGWGDGGCCYGDWVWGREGVEVGEIGCSMAGWLFMGNESGSVSWFLDLHIWSALTGKEGVEQSHVPASACAGH